MTEGDGRTGRRAWWWIALDVAGHMVKGGPGDLCVRECVWGGRSLLRDACNMLQLPLQPHKHRPGKFRG